MTKLDQLQAKIREACPSDFDEWSFPPYHHKEGCDCVLCRCGPEPIWLHHVLRAVGKEVDCLYAVVSRPGYIGLGIGSYSDSWEESCLWNLTKPLEGQDESVHQFLFNLLCK